MKNQPIPSPLPTTNHGTGSTSKKRDELSLCTVVFCLLVIFIHVSSDPLDTYRQDSILYLITLSLHRLSSFVVQGFLFLSGVKLFLHFSSDSFSYKKFYLSRLCRVVLPYIAAVAIYYAYYLVLGLRTFSVTDILRHIFLGDLVSHFYFVVIICQFYLLMPLWRALAKKADPTLTLLVSMILMLILKKHLPEILQVLGFPWFNHNHRLFTSYLFYFVFGMFVGLRYDRFREMLRKQTTAITAAWVVTAAVNCLFFYWNSIGKYYPHWLEDFHVLYCILSVLLVLILADRMAKKDFYQNRIRPAVSLVDKASYHIYLIHPIFIFLSDMLLFPLAIGSVSLRYLIRFIVVYLLSLSMSLLWKIRLKKER